MRAPLAFDLPCPWVPLQSITAAASRDSRSERAVGTFARQSYRAARSARLRIRSRVTRPKECGRASVTAMGQAPHGSEAGLLEARSVCAESRENQSLRSTPHAISKDGVHANSSQRASPDPEPKPEMRCFLEAVRSAEADWTATKPPLWLPTAEAVGSRRGTLGAVCPSGCRSNSTDAIGSRKLPPTGSPPKWFADARHAAWEFDDSSHGVRSPSAFVSGRSLCRFASPTPSTLRVSHPLSGLIPPEPRGSVSRHIRPWGFVPAFRAFPTQPAVTPLDALCSLAVPADSGLSRASSRWTFAPAFDCPLWPTTARPCSNDCPCIPNSEPRHQPKPRSHRSGAEIRRAAETASGVIARCVHWRADGS
jgi:hypothetical protein